jgi:hypothetical protein
MNKENLNILIKFFEQLPDRKVDLDDWRSFSDAEPVDDDGWRGFSDDVYASDAELVDNYCGACGCIVGWLTVLTGVKVERFEYENLAQYLCVSNAIAESLATPNVSIHESVFTNDKAIVLYRLKNLLNRPDSVL